MKRFFFILLLLPIFSFAQVNVNGVTKSNSEKIYFSHITFEDVNGNKFSTISNENAEYKINLKSIFNLIITSYLFAFDDHIRQMAGLGIVCVP